MEMVQQAFAAKRTKDPTFLIKVLLSRESDIGRKGITNHVVLAKGPCKE